MAQKLNDRIKQLENEIRNIKAKVLDLTTKTEAARIAPESKISRADLSSQTPMPSTGTGLGKLPARAGNVIFNDADAQLIPFGQMPDTPTKGYNKHSHSRYAGGALDIKTLELVEFEDLDASGHNRHTQSYWKDLPKIKKEGDVEKIGLLDIEFDPTSGKWVAGSKEIDIERTDLVRYEIDEETGEKTLKKDENNQDMKAPMYGTEENTQNVVWDENAKCFRFLAVYADEEE